jgi:hypothetical protein
MKIAKKEIKEKKYHGFAAYAALVCKPDFVPTKKNNGKLGR